MEYQDLYVIWVDDEAEILDVAKNMVAEIGANVITCLTSQEALEALDRHGPKCMMIVSDYQMPETNGLELRTSIPQKMAANTVCYRFFLCDTRNGA
jgi:CheY-like chemotaxis protein